jgi:GNAT superfamily N-acetyltransferase
VTAGFVRLARAPDAAGLARVQVASWRASLAGLLPDAVLAELTSAEAAQRWAGRWLEAITKPPTSRHRVHVAITQPDSLPGIEPRTLPGSAAGAAAATAAGGAAAATAAAGAAGAAAELAGFAAAGPATDADLWPGTDAELYELHVLPALTGQGHGGRLLHAVADTLAEDGFRTAYTWALSGDDSRLEFLQSAGWAPDGSHSNLDMGVKVRVVRLHTLLAPA